MRRARRRSKRSSRLTAALAFTLGGIAPALRGGAMAMLLQVAIARAQAPAGGDEIILDPELAGLEEIPAPPVSDPAPLPAQDESGRIRVVLRSRLGIDTSWDDPREDVIEATQLALFEARVRRSESLHFEVGLRALHLLAAREHDTADGDAERYELDLAPTAGYADLALMPPLHLRLGYQSVYLGRFDVLGASDVLSARDLRSGPTTLPEASEIAQPAARLDWDVGGSLALQAIVLPFFQPHVVHAFEGDYALAHASQEDVDAAYRALAANTDEARRLAGVVRGAFSRSAQREIAETTLDAFAPEPDLSSPQAALRILAHGGAGELGLTLASAREHLPALGFSDALLSFAREPTAENEQALAADPRPIAVRYDRFALAALDGALPLGPVQLGAELSYQQGRTLFSVAPGELPQPDESDLAQLGVRLEYVPSAHVALVLESSAARALNASRAPDGGYQLLVGGRWLLAAAGFAAFSPGDTGLTLELGAALLAGPSYVIAPRIELPIVDALFAETGAYWVGGDGARNPALSGASLGAMYDDVDQVFVGLRWLP